MGSKVLPGRLSERKANLLLLAAAVALALLGGEVVARLMLPAPLPWFYPQLRYRHLPGIGFGLVPGEIAYTADKKVAINAHGLRGEPVPYLGKPGHPRLMFLGDSIVFGYGVDEKEAVPERLAQLLREDGIPAQVVNAGVPAYNLDNEIAYLEQAGLLYQPDTVIVGFCWNDINDNVGVKVTHEGWLVSADTMQGSPVARFLGAPIIYEIRNAMKRSRVAYAGMIALRELKEGLSPDDHFQFRRDVLEGRSTEAIVRGWERVDRDMQRLKELAMEHRFQPLVVAFPLPLALERDFPRRSYPGRLRDAAAREGIPILDLEGPFRRAFRGHDSLFIPYDADHLNSAGHDLAARAIRDFLKQGGIPPFRRVLE